MSLLDAVRLISLAAIWGGSFFLMRIAAPVLGPAFLMEGRVLFAAIFLLGLARYLKQTHELSKHWKHFLIMGVFNCALPWYLFGQAALKLTTGQLSILNALAPLCAFLIGWLIGTEKIVLKRSVGLLLGIVGVVVLFAKSDNEVGMVDIPSILMGVGASLSYGLATNYTKTVTGIAPLQNALGSLWMASLLLIPTLFLSPVRSEITVDAALATLLIGVLCSGIALLIYFKLVENLGAASALTVTFLIPVFGTLWGVLFLDEIIGLKALTGMAIIVSGTALVTGFNPKSLFNRC